MSSLQPEEVLPQTNMSALLKDYLFLPYLDVLGCIHLNVLYWKVGVLQCFFFFLITDQWLGREEKSAQWRGECVSCEELCSSFWEVVERKLPFLEGFPPVVTPFRIESGVFEFCLHAMWGMKWSFHAKRMVTAQSIFQVCGFVILILVCNISKRWFITT